MAASEFQADYNAELSFSYISLPCYLLDFMLDLHPTAWGISPNIPSISHWFLCSSLVFFIRCWPSIHPKQHKLSFWLTLFNDRISCAQWADACWLLAALIFFWFVFFKKVGYNGQFTFHTRVIYFRLKCMVRDSL